MKGKGQIALDIDGTLTHGGGTIPHNVIEMLRNFEKEGWLIHFVTGRTFLWAMHVLHTLPFPFFVSAFNGAQTVCMPKKEIVFEKRVKKSVLPSLMAAVCRHDVAAVVYAERNGVYQSFFYQAAASPLVVTHLRKRFEKLGEQIQEIDVIAAFPHPNFLSLRCFGLPQSVLEVGTTIEQTLGLSAPRMMDSADPQFSIVQVTAKGVTKGSAVKQVFAHMQTKGVVIACGDDHNDIPMFATADIAVVMASAPHEVLSCADIVAPSAQEHGIIQGLQQAMQLIEEK